MFALPGESTLKWNMDTECRHAGVSKRVPSLLIHDDSNDFGPLHAGGSPARNDFITLRYRPSGERVLVKRS